MSAAAAVFALVVTPVSSWADPLASLPSVRDQTTIRNEATLSRLDRVDMLMREQGVDMWVLIAREYVEDPVMLTMLPAESFNARRRTILVLHDPGDNAPVERLTVSRYGLGDFFKSVWNPEEEPDQWRALAALIERRNPKRIAINMSARTRFADGLTASQYQELRAALSPTMRERLVSSDALTTRWLELRTPNELSALSESVAITHALIAEAFSNATITPGRTTAADVQWAMRQRMATLGLQPWFHPSVAVMRQGEARWREGDIVIQPGDMLHTDVGIVHLGMASDIQQLGYVLRPGEADAPQGLKDGFKTLHAAGDALMQAFVSGRTGNDVLVQARAAAKSASVDATYYSHPIGLHGHAAGPAIGFWDNQSPSPAGEDAVRPFTAWAIEFSAKRAVPEWGGQVVDFRSEEDAWFDGSRVRLLSGRQDRFHLVSSR